MGITSGKMCVQNYEKKNIRGQIMKAPHNSNLIRPMFDRFAASHSQSRGTFQEQFSLLLDGLILSFLFLSLFVTLSLDYAFSFSFLSISLWENDEYAKITYWSTRVHNMHALRPCKLSSAGIFRDWQHRGVTRLDFTFSRQIDPFATNSVTIVIKSTINQSGPLFCSARARIIA